MKHRRIIHTPKRVMPGILLAIFLDAFCNSIFVPAVVLAVSEVQTVHFKVIGDDGHLAILIAVPAILQAISAPLIGQFSDRFGRRLALYYSLIGSVFGHGLFVYGVTTSNFAILLVGRLLDAATGGSLAIARSIIADVDSNTNRVTYFGLLGGVASIGTVLGTVLGLQAAAHTVASTSSLLVAAVLLAGFNAAVVTLYVPETYRFTSRWRIHPTRTISYLLQASRAVSHRVLFTTTFFYMMGVTAFMAALPAHLRSFGYSHLHSQEFLLALLVVIAVAQAVLAPLSAQFFRSHHVLAGILPITAGLGFYVLGPWSSQIGTEVVSLLLAACFGLTMAQLTALVSGTASKHLQGEILGIDIAMHAAATAVIAAIAIWQPQVGTSLDWLTVAALCLAGMLYVRLYRPPSYALTVNKV